ncbi:hypothetical protein [Ralstonia mannitolilytica]|uniref:hypothetical protein n=1 Tax=Ralstonia mannitolilytica TaxID=105219 RepID=UPI0026F1E879|nr:hypothetical protein [Ralstonia mannitolilytica]
MPDDDAITKGSAAMRLIAGPLNKQLLQNLLGEVIESCTRVRAAVAYASRDNMKLFERLRAALEAPGVLWPLRPHRGCRSRRVEVVSG